MKVNLPIIILVVVGLATLTAVAILLCLGKMKTRIEEDRVVLSTIDDLPKAHWAKLAEKKIFFGHQSVGYNIIDGIKDVIGESDHIRLNIVETREPSKFDQPIFAHARVGKNMDPVSKIKSFKNVMDAGVGNKVDIAFLKFCYIDVMRDSDPQRILDDYSSTIEDLKTRYPKAKFLHVTVPICSGPKSIERVLKESVKRLIGRPGVLDDNKMRQRYNTLLKDAYSQKEPIFDLALIESVNPIGCRYYATKGTAKVCVMVPEYTDDGGHLNKLGRRKVAEQLLITLAQMANHP